MLMYKYFDPLKYKILVMGINLNNYSKSEHVPYFKRQNQVLKEIFHACHHTLTFKAIPKTIMVCIVSYYGLCINDFPPRGMVSVTVILCKIISGIKIGYNLTCKVQSGSYVHTMRKVIQPILLMPVPLE